LSVVKSSCYIYWYRGRWNVSFYSVCRHDRQRK